MYHSKVNSVIDARAFIYSSSNEAAALLIDSDSIDTKIIFLNKSKNPTTLRPRLELSASNQDFVFHQDSNELLRVRHEQISASNSVFTGRRFEVSANATSTRRSVILNQTVTNSDAQFTGFGFENGILNYQVPTTVNKHVFYTGATPNTSYELMRIETTPAGNAQLALGIPAQTMTSNLSLQVGGDTQIDGRLIVKGGIDMSQIVGAASFVTYDSNTHRIPTTALPSNVVLLNPSTNQIDESILPYRYNYNFLKFQQSVGIGTKIPKDKLHVEGSSLITQRMTVGSNMPSTGATCTVVQSSPSIPSFVVQQDPTNTLADAFQIRMGNSNLLSFDAGGTLKLATANSNLTSISCAGSIITQNALQSSSVTTSNLQTNAFQITDVRGVPILRTQTVLKSGLYTTVTQSLNEFQCFDNLATNFVSTTNASVATVSFSNCGIYVQRQSTFQVPIVTVSDANYKTDILPLDSTNALHQIDQLQGVRYRMKDDPSHQIRLGLIAQDVEPILPEVVLSTAQSKGIQYESLIAVLIESVKALSAKVRNIEALIGRTQD